jgi:RloB-like protein
LSPAGILRTGLRLARRDRFRDLRLYLVASEDTYAVKQYFDALKDNEIIDDRKVEVRVLPSGGSGETAHSDPASVLARLIEAVVDEPQPFDERWLCLDLDHWGTGRHAPNLARVCKEALDAGCQLAISNPAFEVWLLLHCSDEPKSTQAECEAAIRAAVGSYNKARLQPDIYTRDAVDLAINRARALDTDPTQRWPQQPGSHVYRLVERLPRRV